MAKKAAAKKEKKPVKRAADKKTSIKLIPSERYQLKNLSLVPPAVINKIKSFHPTRKLMIAIVILLILGLAYFNKGLLVAAMVNGQPITTLELNQRLNQSYKDKTLTQMINEKIIEQQVAKQGITVGKNEVDAKMTELENSFGGAGSFNMLLAQQGLSRDDFIRQTRLELMVEKMYAKEINPSEDDIKKFMEDNKNSPEATDEAKFREVAVSEVKQQKLNNIFSQKFPELKQQAKIQVF